MGSGVSESHERSIKFRLRHCGCCQLQESCNFTRPQSESVFVFFCLRLRLSPSSSFWGVVSCKGAATSLVPRVSLSSSSSVSVFVCLRLRLSPSSSFWGAVSCKGAATSLIPRVSSSLSVSVFARLRLSPSCQVHGWSRVRRLSVRCSTSRVWKPLWRERSKCVRHFVECAVS